MSPKEIKALVKTLRSLGVTHYKTDAIELNISAEAPIRKVKERIPTAEEDKEIKHKIEEFTSLMKIGDQELVERLFPDHQHDAEAEH